jgi:small subunit ribosomal protein S18
MSQCAKIDVTEVHRKKSSVLEFSDCACRFVPSSSLPAPFLTKALEDEPTRRSATAELLASFGDTPPPPSSRASALSGFSPPSKSPSPVDAVIDKVRASEAGAVAKGINLSASRGSSSNTASASVLKLLSHAQSRKAQNKERESGQLSLTGSKEIENLKRGQDLSRQITRRWKAGDVYAPHDLSAVEMAKWKNRGRPTHDVFDVLDFKPMEHYRVSFLHLCWLVHFNRSREIG